MGAINFHEKVPASFGSEPHPAQILRRAPILHGEGVQTLLKRFRGVSAPYFRGWGGERVRKRKKEEDEIFVYFFNGTFKVLSLLQLYYRIILSFPFIILSILFSSLFLSFFLFFFFLISLVIRTQIKPLCICRCYS